MTDEDAMLALKGVGLSFKVTGGGTQTPTNADARLESIESVTSLLQWIEKHVKTLEDQIWKEVITDEGLLEPKVLQIVLTKICKLLTEN